MRSRVIAVLVVLAPACGGDDGPASADTGGSTAIASTSTTTAVSTSTGDSSTAAESSTGEELPPYEPIDLLGSIDLFLGTGGIGFRAASVYPGPALPFGMIHPGPDTSLGAAAFSALHCSGYYHGDTHIQGFSLTRMSGTGVPDYGTMAFMPVDGMTPERHDEDGYYTAFDHAGEAAEPGFYRVRLDSGIDVEITTSLRSAIFRFTFDAGLDPVVLLDADHVIGEGSCESADVAIDPDTSTMAARMHNLGDLSDRFGGFDVFAHAVFDTKPVATGVWDDTGLLPDDIAAEGVDVGAWFQFAPGTRTVTMRVGMSLVGPGGARDNLEAEIPDFDFDDVRARATQAWTDALAALEVFDLDPDDATMFATAWYRTLLMPTLMSDVDGRAMGADDAVHGSPDPRFSDFSLWDTYRTVHPWFLLLEHEHDDDFVASLVAMGEEGGAVPRWALAKSDARSMIGSPGEIVLAESALKGVAFDDEDRAYELARITAFGPPPGEVGGRTGIDPYLEFGYVTSEWGGGSVSHTLEYAIADAALANWAERLGRDGDATMLRERSRSPEDIFDPEVGFFAARTEAGPFAPFQGATEQDGAYIEGDAWQYLWLVPHDPDLLAEILGGPEAARARLEEYFGLSAEEVMGFGPRTYHWQGNQPDIHAPWLFSVWGDRPRAAFWVDWVVREFYDVGENGMPGNDDAGTMSSWLLFAATGLYPIAGTDRYMIAAPRQRRLDLHRESGTLSITAEPDPRTHPVPVRVLLDGAEVEESTLRHDQLVGDHELRFEMSD